MGGQILDREDTGSNRNDLTADLPGGLDVVRGVADKANLGLGTEPTAGLGDGMLEDIRTKLAMIGEAAKLKVMLETGSLELDPSDGFEIAGRNAEQFPLIVQARKNFGDAGQNSGCELMHILVGVAAGGREGFGHLRVDDDVREADAPEGRAQDARVGFAVIGDPVDGSLNMKDVGHGAV